MLRVGLTGGIACGKSHVLARLAARGIPTLDLDRVAHAVMAPGGAAYDAVVRSFGPAVVGPTGNIDRKRLASIVFADAAARETLNALVHPRIREVEEREAATLAVTPGALLVTDAALLVETGFHLRFERLVVVHCAPEEQLRRLMARDQIEEGAARARLLAQLPIAEKRRFAHFEIDTSGALADTEAAADRLSVTLRALAASPAPRVSVPFARAAAIITNGPAHGPRGLDPVCLLEAVTETGTLELERLARRLDPPAPGPWLAAARTDEGEPGPETLAGPLVLWALGRAGADRDFLVSAAASLARLTHREPPRIAAACLAALALGRALVAKASGPTEDQDDAALAARWAGAPVAEPVKSRVRALVARMLEPAPESPRPVADRLRRFFESAR